MATSDVIPVIDVGAWTRPELYTADDRAAVAAAVGRACREVGFFAIRQHAVDDKIITNAWAASRDFFDLPLTEKLDAKTDNDQEYPYGYENTENLAVGKGSKNNAQNNNDNDTTESTPNPPDLKETFAIGPSNPASGMPARRFPANPVSLEPSLTAYFTAMEHLALVLLKVFAVALELPETWFRNKMDHHCSALRILNYCSIQKSDMLPGQLRASAHTDYGALTILKSGGPGLQVKKDDNDNDDAWIDVPHLEDAFIINLGDMMRQWTNDRWMSTLHRVVVTQEDAERRQSIAYFCNVNGDCMVDPRDMNLHNAEPKYEPISARDHLMAKHLASMGVVKTTTGTTVAQEQ